MNNLNEILQERDKYSINSFKWLELNEKKANLLEQLKPSTKEKILYFNEEDVDFLKLGFTVCEVLFPWKQQFENRSWLEYHPLQRHPIPYIIIRYKDKYFFILREQGSGELRLIGKIGMPGGHIAIEDKGNTLQETIENGLYRELLEETGITKDMILNINLKGYIKSNEGVDSDHLGLVYEVEINTDNIKSEEEGVLTGLWINVADLHKYYDKMESWAKIVYDNILINKK